MHYFLRASQSRPTGLPHRAMRRWADVDMTHLGGESCIGAGFSCRVSWCATWSALRIKASLVVPEVSRTQHAITAAVAAGAATDRDGKCVGIRIRGQPVPVLR